MESYHYAEIGYRFGYFIKRVCKKIIKWERQLSIFIQRKGFPVWTAKILLITLITVTIELFAASLFLLASALLILANVGFSLIAIAKGMASDEIVELDSQVLEGYCDGPDGVGEYAGGERVDKD